MVSSLGEYIAREALRELFPGHRFHPAHRLPWLIAAGGSELLEIDCYDEELRICLEYQGAQHYAQSPLFHRTEDDFVQQQKRDELKRSAAEDAEFVWIEVPYTINPRRIRSYVHEQIRACGFDESSHALVSDEEFYARIPSDSVHAAQMLDKAHTKAQEHDCVCTSTEYLGCHTPLSFVCNKAGHEFRVSFRGLVDRVSRNLVACSECGGATALRPFDEDAEAVAAAPGFVLLSSQQVRVAADANGYQKPYKQFTIRCPAGHEFEALRTNFLPVTEGVPKHGCARCNVGGKKEQTARSWGLEAVSPIGQLRDAVTWRCIEHGHEFTRTWETMKRRPSPKCPLCAA